MNNTNENINNPKQDIKSYTKKQLDDAMQELNLPSYRSEQVFTWLHQKNASDFGEMTTLSKSLRTTLEDKFYIDSIKIEQKHVSTDGTVKYVFELSDGNRIESVLMKYKHGMSLCISTQVGCRMGCGFCASTANGLVRDLTAGEMLEQVYMAGGDCGERISTVVLMGIGEPLDNLRNVLIFLENLSSPMGINLSLRHVTISTCGVVDKIHQLAKEKLSVTLSVSLHAPNDKLRSELMPINKSFPITSLVTACREYFAATGRRVTFEYALINGVNDSKELAQELAERLKGMAAHVNLIPVNSINKTQYRRSSRENTQKFMDILVKNGLTATVRRELGADISGACGQLVASK